jgi:pteridine reductase
LCGYAILSFVQIKDKLAVVTGGARRVGRAIVESLAEEGARPVIHYHNSRDEAHRLAEEVRGHAVQADLSHPDGAKQLVEQVLDLDQDLAVWVNSAAIFEQRTYLESDDEIWRRTLQLDLLSPVTCIRQVARDMTPGGVVINILDVAAHQPWKGYAHHCVAKAALLMLTRALALELAPRLRVCAVSPGLVEPAESLTEAQRQRLIERIPLRRQGTPEDVGRAVCSLVGADYLTGSVLAVDGGLTIRSLID